MKKHILIMSICSLFVFGLFSACGSGSGSKGGGGGGGAPTTYNVSSLEVPYTIEPMQRNGEGGTMVGIKVNPPITTGLNVTLSDGTNDLQLKSLGEGDEHNGSVVCSSCHENLSNKAGASYFAACSISNTNSAYMTCTTSTGEPVELNSSTVKMSVKHDNPAIVIVGAESLGDIDFNAADASYAQDKDKLSIAGINDNGLAGTSNNSNAVNVEFTIDASDYPADDYGNIRAELAGGTGNDGIVVMDVKDNPNNLNEVIATAKCYADSISTMQCTEPSDTSGTNYVKFPSPLKSSNIKLGTTEGNYPPGTNGNVMDPPEDTGLDNSLDNAISSDPDKVTISTIAGATIPLQTSTTYAPVAVAITSKAPAAITLGGVDIKADTTYDAVSKQLSIACAVTGTTDGTNAQIKCNNSTPITTTTGSVALQADLLKPINIAVANPINAMTVQMHVDSGSLPMTSILGSVSVTLRFVVDNAYSKVQCGMYSSTAGDILGGLIGTVDNLLLGDADMSFPAQTPDSNGRVTITTVCTYNPGVLNLVATSLTCTGATNPSANLLALLDNDVMVMACTTGSMVGETTPFQFTSGLLGLL